MLKAFFYGAVAAFVGSKLKKMNDEGRLEPYKEQARQKIAEVKDQLKDKTAELEDAGQRLADTNVSKPANAHPWPADGKALQSN